MPFVVLLEHLCEGLMHLCMLNFSSFHWFVDEVRAQTLPYSNFSSTSQLNHELNFHTKFLIKMRANNIFVQYLLQILLIITQTKVYISIYSTKLYSSPIICSVQRTISSLWTNVTYKIRKKKKVAHNVASVKGIVLTLQQLEQCQIHLK